MCVVYKGGVTGFDESIVLGTDNSRVAHKTNGQGAPCCPLSTCSSVPLPSSQACVNALLAHFLSVTCALLLTKVVTDKRAPRPMM